MDDERFQLLAWVKEYEIEKEIVDIMADCGANGETDGYAEAVKFVETYFDGWGEAEWIVSYYTS